MAKRDSQNAPGGQEPLAQGKWELLDKYAIGPISKLFRKRPVLAAIVVIIILLVVIVLWQKQISYESDQFAFRVRGVPSVQSEALRQCIGRAWGNKKEDVILSA